MTETQQTYQVLARKYRPETFADLVGQDAMVRTLKNAFAADRIAQAFIMTGIRGTGKTTTARIIAKGMNCIGPDGAGGPTTEPCGTCEHCVAISEGRHVDVLEMDAASRTGVNDIREIIESVHYRAASARYKIYIIDEVHMLSTSAFNALLKTLEEPPPHVKFIFATTEIRKVPVTVLSRCQRFDLRRIEPEVMIALLRRIATAEAAQISDDALALITRAAEGSARDATSLLDQAISHGAGETGADQVRAMLGLADRGRVIDLAEMILRGDAASALTELQAQYADGADPVAVLRDLAEITHWISVVKITPQAIDDPTISPDERMRGQALAERLAMRVLTRLWQMLLKALDEVSTAPNAMMAAEMAVIRLTHVADLPDPEALIRKVQQAQAAGEFTRQPAPAGNGRQQPRAARPAPVIARQPSGAATALAISPDAFATFPDFASVLDLIRRMGDMLLLVQVENHVALVRYSPGRIEFEPRGNAPADLAQRLAERLRGWCGGQRWAVTVTSTGGGATIAETRAADAEDARRRALDLPMVQQVLAAFPGARLTGVTRIAPDPGDAEEIAAEGAANPHDTQGPVAEAEEWDPFEDED
ncbi:DNA polymerase III subunit gamma/tau [Paracoccus marinaquae]|uniref:DNA polymerase III subunit gamma/tau n=1 Tax=Paracoccus marinaquae TaxID=2841926 RepID=A0ABS6AMU8_9RHOB|nr:DNA polymerase III subunit gamma/tau [Paracoccus marinaquae]MBU3031819.1 DNA polymerase III subunit gamma/tau [Paracoccus marinaquae]